MTKVKAYEPNWADDVLKRSESAKFLTQYLNKLYGDSTSDNIYSSSFVLCLNADWGYGKTFLIERWSADLKCELKHPVIYFDAWKNDFSDDPLIAFVSELETELDTYKTELPQLKDAVNSVIEMGKSAIVPTLKTAANILVKKALGADLAEMAELYESASQGVIESNVDSAVDSHKRRKSKITQFSTELEKLLNELKGSGKYELPMYIFIDELDRCKPTYAIQLLEAIKHIFGTKGVFFIVSTNKLQLSHSIKSVYGAEFDSVSYLQRFFDQEYALPKPNFSQYSQLLINKIYRLSTLQVEQLAIDYDLEKTFAVLAECFSLSLRAQDQVAKQLKAIELNQIFDKKIHHWFLLFLMMFRVKNEEAYVKFERVKVDHSKSADLLRTFFNLNKTIEGKVYAGEGYAPNKGEVAVMEIVREYLRLETINAVSLYKETEQGGGTVKYIKTTFFANNEVPSSFNSDNHYGLSIARYRKAIEQAGHLA